MIDKKSQKITRNSKRKNHAKELRDQQIIVEAAKGKTACEIANKFGMERRQVGKILNGEMAKASAKQSQLAMHERIERAWAAFDRALESTDEKLAFEASKCVLKTTGAISEKQTLEVTRPKPTVIEKLDGKGELVLGTEDEDKNENNR